MEIFKQLKQKGYKHYYEGTVEELDSMNKNNSHLYSELMQIIMWLYEKHGIWVSVSVDTLFNKGKFCILIYKDKGLGLENYPLDNTEFSPYESPTEAYEAALKYCLEKII